MAARTERELGTFLKDLWPGDQLRIGDATVTVLKGGRVRLKVEAPRSVAISSPRTSRAINGLQERPTTHERRSVLNST